MGKYTKQELEGAKTALTSTLHKCEKIDEGKKLRKSQQMLLDRRIKAIRLALELISKEMGETFNLSMLVSVRTLVRASV